MTLRKYAINYSRDCTHEELLEFLRQRLGGDPLPRRFKFRICTSKLRYLDSVQTFRFLDLLPEIRNKIYDMVLTHNNEETKIRDLVRYNWEDPTKRVGIRCLNLNKIKQFVDGVNNSIAYPALLAVSRQIKNEAIGYLDRNSIAVYELGGGSGELIAEPYLSRITVVFNCHWTMFQSGMEKHNSRVLQNDLTSLVDHHMQFRHLKTIRVVLVREMMGNYPEETYLITRTLLALVYLPKEINIELVGFNRNLVGNWPRWVKALKN